jgi:hypothetical protein
MRGSIEKRWQNVLAPATVSSRIHSVEKRVSKRLSGVPLPLPNEIFASCMITIIHTAADSLASASQSDMSEATRPSNLIIAYTCKCSRVFESCRPNQPTNVHGFAHVSARLAQNSRQHALKKSICLNVSTHTHTHTHTHAHLHPRNAKHSSRTLSSLV